MKMVFRILGLAMMILLLAQCQKVELPSPGEGTPVFSLQGSLNGAPLAITAGDSSYVLRASSFTDTAEVPVYRATFGELDCSSGCLPSVTISIRGAGPGAAQPDTDLSVGMYPLRQPVEDTMEISYRMAFFGLHEASTADAPVSYHWDFGDGATSDLRDPEHEYQDNNPRRVRLETQNASGCTSSRERMVAFIPPPVPCEVDFTLQPPQGASPPMAVFSGSLNNYSFWSWFQNDSSMLASYPITQLLPQEIREVCLTAVNTEGCQAQTCKSVFLSNNPAAFGFCSTDFTYQPRVDTFFTPAPDRYGTAWIDYSDGTGQTYSSALGYQDTTAGNFFEVDSIEPFEPNENGMPTQKLKVRFRCRLYGIDGQPFGILEAGSTIAVAHP
ncbi:MAG: PKD domain-containing protein [Lewinellaceae bacterium]|nr:PKD domain-containing protein [Lewinellaceae bacterium]